ncbi:MAG: amidoligase family protein [Thermoguttaceae bacterium]
MISIVSYLESGIFATTGTKHREVSSYCNGIRKHGSQPKAKEVMDHSRYNVLNTRNLTNDDTTKRTVEFRAFSGSLNATKIIGWIQLCLGVVEKAVTSKRTPSWEPKPASGGWARKGKGESETERLLGYLAWGNGYAKLHKGKQYGWISNAIPMDEIKTEFRRLARKYDSSSYAD